MSDDKQYFDRLEEEYSNEYGHQLYAIDEEKEIKHHIGNDLTWNTSSRWGMGQGEIHLTKSGYFPLTLRKIFDNQETMNHKEKMIAKIIESVHLKENRVSFPTSKYNRNK